jgi:hypothetical protein
MIRPGPKLAYQAHGVALRISIQENQGTEVQLGTFHA